jgi:hypothetical protein
LARRAPSPLALLKARLAEAGSPLYRVRGPAALARLLAARAGSPLWLEEHPWLKNVAGELEKLSLKPLWAAEVWAPGADTAVSVALGAIPETGTVLLRADLGVASWLPFRARKQIVLVPRERAALTLAAALDLTRHHLPGMVSWLTGPTRTADIEKVLVLGAQGPQELEVVLYQPTGKGKG